MGRRVLANLDIIRNHKLECMTDDGIMNADIHINTNGGKHNMETPANVNNDTEHNDNVSNAAEVTKLMVAMATVLLCAL